MTTVQHISAAATPLAHFLSPATLLRTLWGQRGLVAQLTWRNVLSRYRGSVLGAAWSFVLPLVMLTVYTFVFGVLYGARAQLSGETTIFGFALFLYCGLLVYSIFAETLAQSVTLIISNPGFVKKVVFPLEVLPVCTLAAAIVHAGVGLVVLLACASLYGMRPPTGVVWLPLVLAPLAALTLGLSWVLASLGVYVRDTAQVIGAFLQMLMFLAPVFYSIEHWSAAAKFVIRLNPLTVLIEGARRTLLAGQPPDWAWLAYAAVASGVVMQLGFAWFMKTKRGFADVL